MLSYLSAVFMLMRRLRGDRLLIVTAWVVIAFTAFVAAATPRLYNQLLDEELRHRVTNSAPGRRAINVTLADQRLTNPNEEIGRRLDRLGNAYREALPAEVGQALRPPSYTLTSPRWLLNQPLRAEDVPFERVLNVHYPKDVEQHIELVDGRLPEPREPVPAPPHITLDDARADQPLAVFEIVLSEQAATELRLAVGDSFVAVYQDNSSVLAETLPSWFIIELVGVFTRRTPSDDYWAGDARLDAVSWLESSDEPVTQGRARYELTGAASALISIDAYLEFVQRLSWANWSYTWRFPLEPTAVDATSYRDIATQAGSLEVTKGPWESLWLQPGPLSVRTGLPELFDSFEQQTRFTLSVIALTAMGVLGAGAAAFALLAALIAERRRDVLALVRGRGATTAQLIGAQLVEGVLLCAPAAVFGYLAAAMLIDARASRWSALSAVAVGLLALVLLAVAARTNLIADLGTLLARRVRPTTPRSLRRVTLEVALIVGAVASVVALRRRGLADELDSPASLDPLLVAVPLLLGVAAGIGSLWLYPHAIRLLARITQRRRGLLLFIGLKRGSELSLVGFLPFVVILLAVSVSVFASVIRQSVSNAQQVSAWQTVGADARIDVDGLDALAIVQAVDASNVEEVAAALLAPGMVADTAAPTSGALATTALQVLALDTAAYQRVAPSQADAEAVSPLTLKSAAGTEADPLPIILSSAWPEDERPAVGSVLRLDLSLARSGTVALHVTPIATAESFPGLAEDTPYAIVDLAQLRSVAPGAAAVVNTLYVRGTDAATSRLVGMLAAQESAFVNEQGVSPTIVLRLRSDAMRALANEPLARAVTRGFQLGTALTVIYAVLAVVMVLALTSARRSHDLNILRTLGFSIRQVVCVVLIEYLPLILSASVGGALLGVLTAFLIEPGIDLSAFAGSEAAVALAINWLLIGAIIGGLACTTFAAVVLYSLLNRHRQLGEVLRIAN